MSLLRSARTAAETVPEAVAADASGHGMIDGGGEWTRQVFGVWGELHPLLRVDEGTDGPNARAGGDAQRRGPARNEVWAQAE